MTFRLTDPLHMLPDRRDPEVITIDGNDLQEAAELVADRHMRHGSPEFAEFCNDRMENAVLGRIIAGVFGSHQELQAARGYLDSMRTEFVEALIDNYLGRAWDRALANEMRRELR